ncbi:MAG: hypothetical protein JW955_04150 [Sedimentisphaerales bacterium]|nr:hypothetical protein [Sedimentisphaerales bacterium]
MRRTWLTGLLLGSIVVACNSCASDEASTLTVEEDSARKTVEPATKPAPTANGGLYSRYNIHYYTQRAVHLASCLNYTNCPGHTFVPYGTRFKIARWEEGFKLIALDTGQEIRFAYVARWARMPKKKYTDLIMSPTPVRYDDLSDVDQQGIRAGKAMVGMTKQGVLIALGYPVKCRTRSIDRNRWVYWRNRFVTYSVWFDDNGIVTRTY